MFAIMDDNGNELISVQEFEEAFRGYLSQGLDHDKLHEDAVKKCAELM